MSEQTFIVASLRRIALSVISEKRPSSKVMKKLPRKIQEQLSNECCSCIGSEICAAILNKHYDCIETAYHWDKVNDWKWKKQNLNDLLDIGEIKFVEYAIANGCSFDDKSLLRAIKSKNMDLVQYVIKATKGGVWDKDVLKKALVAKSFKFIKYAREQGAPWAHDSMDIVVQTANIKLMQYMHENGCSWTGETMIKAIKTQNRNVVKFCHENGCPYDKDALMDVCMTTTSLPILKYAFEVMQCKFTPKSMSYAMDDGKFNLVRYAYKNGCSWSKECIKNRFWDSKTWEFAIKNGFVWDEDVLKEALSIGDLEFVKYAHEQGIPWPHDSMDIVVPFLNIELMQYMVDNGCPWTENTMRKAINIKYLKVVKFCHENGCPYDKNYVVDIKINNYTRDLLKYTSEVMGLYSV
jgi:hypothetical protein